MRNKSKNTLKREKRLQNPIGLWDLLLTYPQPKENKHLLKYHSRPYRNYMRGKFKNRLKFSISLSVGTNLMEMLSAKILESKQALHNLGTPTNEPEFDCGSINSIFGTGIKKNPNAAFLLSSQILKEIMKQYPVRDYKIYAQGDWKQ